MAVVKLKSVNKRRDAAVHVVNELQFLERSVHDNVVWASHFAGALIEIHRETSLPPTVGMEVIALLGEVQAAASANCARVSQIHLRLREIGAKHGFPLAGLPDCPDEEKRHF